MASFPRPVVTHLPERITTPVVFASPHSGRVYPEDLLRRAALQGTALRSSEDAYVDLLLAAAPDHGAALITTEVPRAYVDFNRAETELDPALISGAPRQPGNPRVASGLGVIARVVAQGRPLYRGPLTLAEAEARIARCWRPYHAALAGLLADQRARFGRALLIDVHSMPHEALGGTTVGRHGQRPDIVLGDRHGAACRPGILAAVESVLMAEGLRVARNAPFAGAYTAQTYGRPADGFEVVQIEIDRRLYLDEGRVQPGPGFGHFSGVMARVVASLAQLGRDRVQERGPDPLSLSFAAE
jgi:N-formylglutamate amidohydrolase